MGCVLTESEAGEHLGWCRDFIDHNCIFRSPSGNHLLASVNGGLNAWQFYMRVATLDQEFAHRLGLLFWDRFLDDCKQGPFQLCGCETGGVPVIGLLQATAYELDVPVNVFSVKKEAKKYGLGNWLEGIVLEDVPVMVVDDISASQQTLVLQAERVKELTGLPLHRHAFSIASCLPKRSFVQNLSKSLNTELVVLYHLDDFHVTEGTYAAAYGRQPGFRGACR